MSAMTKEDLDRMMRYACQREEAWEDDSWKKEFKWVEDTYIRSILELEKEEEMKRRKAMSPIIKKAPEATALTAIEWLHDKMDELRNAPYNPKGITFEEKSIIMAELSGLIKLFKRDV